MRNARNILQMLFPHCPARQDAAAAPPLLRPRSLVRPHAHGGRGWAETEACVRCRHYLSALGVVFIILSFKFIWIIVLINLDTKSFLVKDVVQ